MTSSPIRMRIFGLFVGLALVTFACEAPFDSTGGDRIPSEPETDAGAGAKPRDAGPTETDGDSGPGGPVDKPSATKKIKNLTGTGTSSQQFGVGGTDLGIPVRQPNGKIAYIFGDTFEDDLVGSDGWRAPVLLRSEPGNLDQGITFTGAAGGSYAKQLFPYSHDGGVTYLPSDVITIGNRMYLHYIINQPLGNVSLTQIAYSDDNGENWTKSGAQFSANDNDGMRQLWTWERADDGYVYIMSTKFISRDKPIIMYRVPDTKLLDTTAYEPWGFKNGKWGWGNPATPILDGKFGELCLRRVENKWVLSWFNSGEYNITIKVFDSPTSNLFTAKTYVPIKGGNWGAESDTQVAQLYGGYIHPDSTLHKMHLIVSQWNTGKDANNRPYGWPYRSMQFITGVDP